VGIVKTRTNRFSYCAAGVSSGAATSSLVGSGGCLVGRSESSTPCWKLWSTASANSWRSMWRRARRRSFTLQHRDAVHLYTNERTKIYCSEHGPYNFEWFYGGADFEPQILPARRSVPAPPTSRSRFAHAPLDFLNPAHRSAPLKLVFGPLRSAHAPLTLRSHALITSGDGPNLTVGGTGPAGKNVCGCVPLLLLL